MKENVFWIGISVALRCHVFSYSNVYSFYPILLAQYKSIWPRQVVLFACLSWSSLSLTTRQKKRRAKQMILNCIALY